MPPKGWRKNRDGPPPTANTELTSIDDILFPKTVVNRLAKNILGEDPNGSGMLLMKDSQLALQRAATVFVSHIFHLARQAARDLSRLTLNTQDVFQALERAQLAGFLPQIKHKLDIFENGIIKKREEKAAMSSENGDSEEPNKKTKANDESAIVREQEVEEVEQVNYGPPDDADEAADAADESLDNDHENEMDVEDDDAEEVVPPNPIAALSKEEAELRGASDTEDAVDTDSNAED